MEEKIMYFIDAHYAEPINLDAIASSLGMSKYYLSRQFKDMTNCSFCDLVNQKRIQVATEQLRNSKDSITEIAMNSGFQSIATFNRIFKQSMGCSPSEFREQLV